MSPRRPRYPEIYAHLEHTEARLPFLVRWALTREVGVWVALVETGLAALYALVRRNFILIVAVLVPWTAVGLGAAGLRLASTI